MLQINNIHQWQQNFRRWKATAFKLIAELKQYFSDKRPMFDCQQCLMLPHVILEGHAHTLSQLKKNNLTFGCMKIVAENNAIYMRKTESSWQSWMFLRNTCLFLGARYHTLFPRQRGYPLQWKLGSKNNLNNFMKTQRGCLHKKFRITQEDVRQDLFEEN